MSLLSYIDNEVPAFGEWDAIVVSGGSSIQQSTEAAFPERGQVGLTVNIVSSDKAYAQKEFAAPQTNCSIGFWWRCPAEPTWGGNLVGLASGGNAVSGYGSFEFYLNNLGGEPRFKIYVWLGPGSHGVTLSLTVRWGRWYWIVLDGTWDATQAKIDAYVNGVFRDTVSSSGSAVSNKPDEIRLGNFWSYPGTDASYHLDEVKIADGGYIEPYLPAPTSSYPEPRRTVVLYREAWADSREFADYCVEKLGIPQANLCPLPNASANESLASYATFQTEVEDDLAAWLSRNPTAADSVTTFLVGYGVPGYFTYGGKLSTTSRLAHYGTAFSIHTANPLYNPSTVSRLSISALRAAGVYLASRIDADTLQHAKDQIDNALAVSALSALADSDVLYSDDATYKASLACQHLRIKTAAIGTFTDDAFVAATLETPPGYGTAGSRCCHLDAYHGSADTLRASSHIFDAVITHGYACGFGFSSSVPMYGPEKAPFLEMLRIGGTFAEAAAIAYEYVDSILVAAGSPLLTVNFQLGGYNIYRGNGGPEAVDWAAPVAYTRVADTTVTAPLAAKYGESYVFAARALSAAGIEERNTSVLAYAEVDELGELLPAPLERANDLSSKVLADGSVILSFSYRSSPGCQQPEAFHVYSDNGTGTLDLDTPVATVTSFAPDQQDFEVVVVPASLPAKLTVRAYAGQRNGPLSTVVTARQAPAPEAIEAL
ncbi:MAG: LamG-like jellyroll fold domain-containing protein [Planctomycetota bacterium]|jgi:hypothetical protein